LDSLAAFSGELTFNNEFGVYELVASLETKELHQKDLSKRRKDYYSNRWEQDMIRVFRRIME